MVVGLLLAATGASWAFSLWDYADPDQAVVFKFRNWDVGTIYGAGNGVFGSQSTPDPTDLDGLAQTGPLGGDGTEDSWGIVKLVEIYLEDDPLTPLIDEGAVPIWQTTNSLEEITGIFWGSQDTYLEDTCSGTSHVQRNEGIDLNAAFFADLKSAGGFTAFNQLAGPTARDASGLPIYPTVTDGTLLWTFNSIKGHNSASNGEFFTEFYPTPQPGTESANGGAWLVTGSVPYWGYGSANKEIAEYIPDPDGAGPLNGCDATFKFTGIPDPGGKWLVQSDDPLRTRVSPELSSSALMLLGLVPIGIGWRRRKTA